MFDIGVLRQALPYIQRHKGACFVIKVGGGALRSPDARAAFARDLSLLLNLGIRITLVHGGGPQATELSERLGQNVRMVNGRRVTDEDTLEVAKMVFAGKINTEMLGALRRHGVAAVGVSGVDGNLISANKRALTEVVDAGTGERSEIDFGYVGDIESVNTSLLRTLMDQAYMPVVSSLGADREGTILNINADGVATAIARDLQAEKLIFLTDVPGVLSDPDDATSLISHLSTEKAKAAMAAGTIRDGMVPKVTHALEALEGHGVRRVHILSGTQSDALLTEVFSTKGTGTLITTQEESKDYQGEMESWS